MKNERNSIKVLNILIFVAIITMINDFYVREIYTEYNSQLRLIDHLLAGISIPIVFYFILGNFSYGCTYYLAWCSYWEFLQYTDRGYFQVSQYFIDLLGICVAIFLYKVNLVVRDNS